ncbi:hypothetical protein [Pseudohaliea rubra]|uniref:Uncharacterized protein n=1 Tax=Pseudohaliea rubra DSM 19751 TaxID=1265313 RepID=A0A095VPL4_9GAMM|nr:hypothetical protein [Pseudohaliea rubra]KGE03043.1 hypothetical protein HRUBRA_02373 [Pseudohaliea rubra DSM 19751]
MTDDTSISYSFSATPAAGASALYAFADCELIPVDQAMMLVINRVNGRQQMISPQVVEALKTCTTFRTLDAHADHLARSQPELKGNRTLAMQALQQLRDGEMLLSAETVKTRLQQSQNHPLAPTRAFIITCDRPEAVERLLESMLRSGSLTRHEALMLVDDSRHPESRTANRDAVERFNLRSARSMSYFGAEEQAALLAHLVAELPTHEAGIRFLLDPSHWTGKKTYGRSRTLCLLLSVGCRAIVMDDDILCEAVRPPVEETGINFQGGRRAAFFPDRDTLLAARVPAAADPLAAHADLLGQQLGNAVRELNNGPLQESQLSECNAAMLNVLDSQSPILVTQCGSWGDPGTGGGHWAVHLGEDSIERLVNAPHGMAEALQNGCNWLGCSGPTIHKMAFMSQMTGLDNSQLLPPYFPAFRGEDLLFGTMVEAMHHRGAVLEYPWAVPHLPLESRRGQGLRAPMAGEGGIVLFSRYLAEHIDYKDASAPQRRLRHMADDARRLAARSDADLLLDYRREQAKGQAHQLHLLRLQAAKARELPSLNWQGYLKRGIEEVQGSIAEIHGPARIRGVPAGSTDEALVGVFRGYAAHWAAALDAWPAVREAAQAYMLPR